LCLWGFDTHVACCGVVHSTAPVPRAAAAPLSPGSCPRGGRP
jgi:hypothetical protein